MSRSLSQERKSRERKTPERKIEYGDYAGDTGLGLGELRRTTSYVPRTPAVAAATLTYGESKRGGPTRIVEDVKTGEVVEIPAEVFRRSRSRQDFAAAAARSRSQERQLGGGAAAPAFAAPTGEEEVVEILPPIRRSRSREPIAVARTRSASQVRGLDETKLPSGATAAEAIPLASEESEAAETVEGPVDVTGQPTRRTLPVDVAQRERKIVERTRYPGRIRLQPTIIDVKKVAGEVEVIDRADGPPTEPIPLEYAKWSGRIRELAEFEFERVSMTPEQRRIYDNWFASSEEEKSRVPVAIVQVSTGKWLTNKIWNYMNHYKGALPKPIESPIRSKEMINNTGDDEFAAKWVDDIQYPQELVNVLKSVEALLFPPLSELLYAKVASTVTQRDEKQRAYSLSGQEYLDMEAAKKEAPISRSRSRRA